MPLILAIESSCDETSVSIVKASRGSFDILSNVISSQVKTHAKTGGIVPEVAARLHVKNILPVLDNALKLAKTKIQDIDSIAVCSGPGLVSSLMVGVETAKTLALVHNKPLIKVNHIEGHILAVLEKQKITFPAIALVVSGGHTQIIHVKQPGKYKLIGQTRDDAAGEAFDKSAKIMGLSYPGGPSISTEAEKVIDPRSLPAGRHGAIHVPQLPRPMLNSDNFDMSFSGLKTAVRYEWRDLLAKGKISNKQRAAFAQEFQNAVVDVLVSKTLKAVEKYKVKTLVLGGGVSANKALKKGFETERKQHFPNLKFFVPEFQMTGDNAGMIGIAAYFHHQQKDFIHPTKLKADPNWELV
jgi:N6-L-threonylcarbamoyladenine synthase